MAPRTPSALPLSGVALLGLLVAACNPSPHLDPPGATGGGSSGNTTTTTNGSQGGGGSGGDTGGSGGTTSQPTTSSEGGSGGGPTTDCDSNADCAYPTNLCDVASGECVECIVTADCADKPGTVCTKAVCGCPVATDEYCPADSIAGAHCANLTKATNDCGSCGHQCFGPCENGACVDAWEPTAKLGAPSPRARHVAVWTGSRMIIWGGTNQSTILDDGAVYDPVARTWTPINPVNAPSPRERATAIWTGNEMIIWGGLGPGGPLDDGARYNPTTNTWLTVPAGGPSPRYHHSATWTGNVTTRMMVFGGTDGSSELQSGAFYVPGDAWSELATTSPPTQRQLHTAVWDDVGSRLIIFGGLGFDPNSGTTQSLASVGLYLPGNIWLDPGAIGVPPAPRHEHTAIWAGSHMIVWGGVSSSLGLLGDGALFDAQGNNEWTPMNGAAPSPRRRHSVAYFKSKNRMVVWGGLGSGDAILDDGGAFDTANSTWTVDGVQKGPPGSVDHTAVAAEINAADQRMIIWGGVRPNGTFTNEGAVLDMQKVP